MCLDGIGVNTTAFGCKLTVFLAPSRLSRFFCVFRFEKMRSMRSSQGQVELRQLGNQLPVLDKANSLCEVCNMSLQFDRAT